MWILTVGYMGVLYCHVLSLEMAIVFTILICLICRRRFFRKETFVTFIKAAGLTIALSLWFIVPFLDYTLNVDMKVFHVGNPIQVLGLYITQLFWVFPWSGTNSYMYAYGMQNVKAYGVGIGFMFVLLASVYLYLQKRNEMKATEDFQMAKLLAGISVTACVMSLSIFPWDALSEMAPIIQNMVYVIQFPYRLLSIATIALTVLSGSLFVLFKRHMNRICWKSYAVIVLLLTILSSLFFMEDNFQHTSWSDLREIASLGTKRVGNGEYLPNGMDTDALFHFLPLAGENVELEAYEKRDGGADIFCVNKSSNDSYVDCSLIYYPGYQAWDKKTGERMEIKAGNNQLIRVMIPGRYEGEIRVDFVGKTMWKIADIFSLCLWIICMIVGCLKFKNYIPRKIHEEKN